MAMLVFSGLRGAIAFALAHNIDSAHNTTIAAATTTIVLFTTFVLGGATRRVLKRLGMEAASSTAMLPVAEHGRSDHQSYLDEQMNEARGPPTAGPPTPPAAADAAGSDVADLPPGFDEVVLNSHPDHAGLGGRMARAWNTFDERRLKPVFGGPGHGPRASRTVQPSANGSIRPDAWSAPGAGAPDGARIDAHGGVELPAAINGASSTRG